MKTFKRFKIAVLLLSSTFVLSQQSLFAPPPTYGNLGEIGDYLGVWGDGATGPDWVNFDDWSPYYNIGDFTAPATPPSLVHNLGSAWSQDTPEKVLEALKSLPAPLSDGLGLPIDTADFKNWLGGGRAWQDGSFDSRFTDLFTVTDAAGGSILDLGEYKEGKIKLTVKSGLTAAQLADVASIDFVTGKAANSWTLFKFDLNAADDMFLFFPPEEDGGINGLSHLTLWTVVPEPSTLLLGALAGGIALLRFRKKRTQIG